MMLRFNSIEQVRDYILNHGNLSVNMISGNGDKKQFKYLNKLKEAVRDATSDMIIKKTSFFIFW